MQSTVFIAVILAAFFHAVWNAMVKKGDDKYISFTAVILGHVPISIVVIFLTPALSVQSIPYIFISAIFLTGYEWCLLSAYRLENYTRVYPIARGIAPIFIVILSLLLFNLSISKFELIGILVISFGIIILSCQNIKTFKNYSAIVYALGTGLFISCYSITDGYGGRVSDSPLNYTAWLFILNAVIFPILLIIMNKPGVVREVFNKEKKIFFIGGTLSYTVYGTIIWAFTQAPIPIVAALRETSIIFALLIGALFLKEKLNLLKIAAVLTIFIGVILLKFF
ncbi:MAG TPA: DMT family transporter [Pelagibacteraceae bacterium]|jgi:drug/metabolite transporter (DMT)-like permease|nr:DMT family transporter [Pelagibacteraceae bacterium]